ncbi:MAG: hypothetical protein ABJP02_10375 [Parasphingorhabdus sp.]|uniref:hypothetical protein n=1 Tax=Parasphingorhabdus sp. TaxID=2709688 RepID=UPI00328AB507
MNKPPKSESFYNLLTVCEQAVGGDMTKNIPLAIGLNIYIAQRSGDALDRDDLMNLVAAVPSTFDRYVSLMENDGVIEKSSGSDSKDSVFMLSDSATECFQSIFED